MVAVPMLSTALGQRFTMLGGTGVSTKMEASIHLRAKDFAAHERWLANLADVITSNGLDDLQVREYKYLGTPLQIGFEGRHTKMRKQVVSSCSALLRQIGRVDMLGPRQTRRCMGVVCSRLR